MNAFNVSVCVFTILFFAVGPVATEGSDSLRPATVADCSSMTPTSTDSLVPGVVLNSRTGPSAMPDEKTGSLEVSTFTAQYLGNPLNLYHVPHPEIRVFLRDQDTMTYLTSPDFFYSYNEVTSTFTLSSPPGNYHLWFFVDIDGDGIPFGVGDFFWMNIYDLPRNQAMWMARFFALTAPVSSFEEYPAALCTDFQTDGLTIAPGQVDVRWVPIPETRYVEKATLYYAASACGEPNVWDSIHQDLPGHVVSSVVEFPSDSEAWIGVSLYGASSIYNWESLIGTAVTYYSVTPEPDGWFDARPQVHIDENRYFSFGARLKTSGASCHSPPVPVLSAPASAGSGEHYDVSWTATSPDDSYHLQEAADASFSDPRTHSVSGTSRSFSHEVTSDTSYFYRVRAVDRCGGQNRFSAWSPTRTTVVSPYTPVGDPDARFVPDNVAVVPGQMVRFFNLSTGATSFAWTFGDGQSSTVAMPAHVYNEAGVFDVSLTACFGTACDTTSLTLEVMQHATTVSGTVVVDGGPPEKGGRVRMIPQWGTWWYRFTNNLYGRFEANDGTWSIGRVPFGAYQATAASNEQHCCGCPVGMRVYHYDWQTRSAVVDADHTVIDFDADCSWNNPFENASSAVIGCLLAAAEAIPVGGAPISAASVAHALLVYQTAIDEGDDCTAWWAATDLSYATFNLAVETATIGLDSPEDFVGVLWACLVAPLGEWLTCDLPDLKTAPEGTLPAIGRPMAFVQVRATSVPGPTLAIESPFGERAYLEGTRTVSNFENPVLMAAATSGVGASLLEPTGFEEVVVTNDSMSEMEVTVPVHWFRHGRVLASQFEIQLAAGATARATLSGLVEEGIITLGGEEFAASAQIEMGVPEYYLPAAAHLEGSGGSTWRSDLVVSNPESEETTYTASYYVPGHQEPVSSFQHTVPAGGIELVEDVVLSQLGRRAANGWVRVVSDSPLLTVQRTYSQREDGGTQGQLLPMLAPATGRRPEYTFVAIEENSSFRTNIGLLNVSSVPNRAELELFGDDGASLGTAEYVLEPRQQLQVNRAVRAIAGPGTTVEGGRLVVTFDRQGGAAYGSKVDNGSADALTVLPQRASEFWLPAVAHASGTGGSQWRTDLRLHAVDSSRPLGLTLTLEPHGVSRQIHLPPSAATHDLSDLFSLLGVGEAVGMLYVQASQDVYVVCRVFSMSAEGDRGQGIPIVVTSTGDQTLATGETGHLIGLRSDAFFRTNIALQNYGESAAQVTVRLIDGSGHLETTLSQSLAPHSFVQRPLAVLVTDDVAIARAEVECVTCDALGAYASLVDNLTDDGSFLPMMKLGRAVPGGVDEPPDEAPTLTAETRSTSEIVLSWTAIAEATEYELRRGARVIYTGPALRDVDSGLEGGTRYCYRVRAVNPSGQGPLSNVACDATDSANWSCGEWQSVDVGGDSPLFGIAFGNGLFVAVGAAGALYTSEDGMTWTEQDSRVPRDLYRVAFGSGVYVAVGAAGTVLTSGDGRNWIGRHTPVSDILAEVEWMGNRFIASGMRGAAITSPNGASWTRIAEGVTDYRLNGVGSIEGLTVIVGSHDHKDKGIVLTSTDLVSWQVPIPLLTAMTSLASDGGRLIAVGFRGKTAISENGNLWVEDTGGTSNDLYDIAYGGSGFLSVGSSGTIRSSTDGSSWSVEDSATSRSLYGIAWGDGRYVAVGDQGRATVLVCSH